jgi:hypothetical protein
MMTPHIGPNGPRFLGRPEPFKPDHRDLLLKNYLDKPRLLEVVLTTSDAPMNCDWSAFPTPSGKPPTPDTDPLGNSTAGDCVLAGPGHMVNMIGKQTGNDALVVTAKMALAAYTKYTGYDPATGENDNGWIIRDMLKAWQQDGLYGTKAIAYALVDHTDRDEVALANWLGCGTIGGYALPITAQSQVDAKGRPQWFVPFGGFPAGKGPGTWGGHCIYKHGDTSNTWGESLVTTQEWDNACCDELWLVAVDCWQIATGRIPSGFAWGDFLRDVQARQQA